MAKAINVKLPDAAHTLLKQLSADSGRTFAKVLELALDSLSRETSIASGAARDLSTIGDGYFVRAGLIEPTLIDDQPQQLPADSEGDPLGNEGAAKALAVLPPSESADHTFETPEGQVFTALSVGSEGAPTGNDGVVNVEAKKPAQPADHGTRTGALVTPSEPADLTPKNTVKADPFDLTNANPQDDDTSWALEQFGGDLK